MLSTRHRSWLLGIFAADCILEVAGITIQAWRHVPSHLNTETPLNTVIAMNLAIGGAVLIAVLGTLALTAFRGRIHATPDMRLALQTGSAILIVGLATGAAMIIHGEILITAATSKPATTAPARSSGSTASPCTPFSYCRCSPSCRPAPAGLPSDDAAPSKSPPPSTPSPQSPRWQSRSTGNPHRLAPPQAAPQLLTRSDRLARGRRHGDVAPTPA